MPENNKTEEFLQKLAPCIERGELEVGSFILFVNQISVYFFYPEKDGAAYG
ncbi:MAG: hypothetical protein WAW23_09440 [Candidatus Methanoperedens sp.]